LACTSSCASDNTSSSSAGGGGARDGGARAAAAASGEPRCEEPRREAEACGEVRRKAGAAWGVVSGAVWGVVSGAWGEPGSMELEREEPRCEEPGSMELEHALKRALVAGAMDAEGGVAYGRAKGVGGGVVQVELDTARRR
jgi:hypothetical protein